MKAIYSQWPRKGCSRRLYKALEFFILKSMRFLTRPINLIRPRNRTTMKRRYGVATGRKPVSKLRLVFHGRHRWQGAMGSGRNGVRAQWGRGRNGVEACFVSCQSGLKIEPTRTSQSRPKTTSTGLTRTADQLTKHAVTPSGCRDPIGLPDPIGVPGGIELALDRRGSNSLSR